MPLSDRWNASHIPWRYVSQRLVNAQASQAQRLIRYLDRLAYALKGFRRAASLLTSGKADEAILRQPVEELIRCWAQRLSQTGAGLDGMLRWCGDGEARCRFVAQGWDSAPLAAEMLTFFLGQQVKPVCLGEGMTLLERVRACDNGLASLGMDMVLDPQHGVVLSMREIDAPSLLSRLRVRGEDGLFPANRQSELVLQPLPGVIAPEDWLDSARLELHLDQAVLALQKVAKTKAEVRERQADMVALLERHLLGADAVASSLEQVLQTLLEVYDYRHFQALLDAIGHTRPALLETLSSRLSA
ncbi:hypothetical protein [Chromobacterium amazonense]|uniref:hypothetical protein n=1 Tax=Chromobacterium amazonense TaxID=1382803 RepID=UPI0031F61EFA